MHQLIDKLRNSEVRLDALPRPPVPREVRAGTPARTSVLVFSPLIHEMSLLALGALSIYHELNTSAKDYAWADRAFFYDFLFDSAGRIKEVYNTRPMLSFEQKIPVRDFDIVAYGMTYPGGIKDFARFMRLAGIPLHRRDRKHGKYPIIVGGGPGFANPEPYGDLLDAFAVGGRAEAPICGLTKAVAAAKGKDRAQVLRELAGVEGIYVPDMYAHRYGKDGRLLSIRKAGGKAKGQAAVRPTPFKERSHNFSSRIIANRTGVIVVSRGCRHQCAFCQLGAQELQNQPLKKVKKVVDELFAAGITTLIINSPTFTQYNGKIELLAHIARRAAEREQQDFKLFIGSVRIDELDDEYLRMLASLKSFNHTHLKYTNDPHTSFVAVAPEFGTDRMMRLMRKGLTRARIIEGVRRAANFGIKNLHCYFLVGIESETKEDRLAIASLVREMMDISGKDSRFYLKINLYIPTVGTIGQRMAMGSVREYEAALRDIGTGIKKLFSPEERKRIDVLKLEEERLLLEALLMRGGRNVRPVLSQLLSTSGETGMTETHLKGLCKTAGVRHADLLKGFAICDTLPWDRVHGSEVKKSMESDFLSGLRGKAPSPTKLL